MESDPLALKFQKLREDFPMLKKSMHGKPLIYFDSAATSQKPQTVIDSITDFYNNHYGTVHRAIYELSVSSSENYQQTREKIKKFLNAKNIEEIIFTKGTTEAINLVAHSFGKAFIKPGDEIIISEIEHHSNIVPWQLMCEERSAILKVIPVDDLGVLSLDAFAKLLNNKTKLVAIGHICNSLGTVNPIKKMIQMAHQVGAKFLVDGAQGAPHLSIDVQDLDADFYTFSGHKIFGPTGIGILYGKQEILNAMPPYQGGGDMIESVTFPKTEYNVLPLKFEAGTPMIAEVIGLGKAIDYIVEIGLEDIWKWEHELLNYATQKIQEIPRLHIIGNAPNKGAIISFVVDGMHPLDIGTLLDLQGVAIRTGHHCAQPTMKRFNVPGTARISFAFYNTKQEIDNFILALEHVIKLLRK
jgi:cysteine desulfurase / selenocysteine lyase